MPLNANNYDADVKVASTVNLHAIKMDVLNGIEVESSLFRFCKLSAVFLVCIIYWQWVNTVELAPSWEIHQDHHNGNLFGRRSLSIIRGDLGFDGE